MTPDGSQTQAPNEDEISWNVLTDQRIQRRAETITPRGIGRFAGQDKLRIGLFACLAVTLIGAGAMIFKSMMPDKDAGQTLETPEDSSGRNYVAGPLNELGKDQDTATTNESSTEVAKSLLHDILQMGGRFDLISLEGNTIVCSEVVQLEAFLQEGNPLRVDWIMVDQTSAGDAMAARLATLPEIKGLGFNEAKITDEGVIALASIESLEAIYLYGTDTTDRSLEALSRLPNLRKLVVSETGITNEGLKLLEGRGSIERLAIKGTRCDRDCLPVIATLSGLQLLDLRDLPINDDDVHWLLKMPQLRDLDLARTDITATGIKQLLDLPRLRDIYVGRSQVSEKEEKEILLRSPALSLHVDPVE